eukprot:CAMPEP_0116043878 /NCGR_PEP_ID=MMETSP0321-20121206/26680_1 /TAXON_ID=163516 /ORGANISM="Leptocylindrus danicus var. danicus, Strain B650" /LENGTH=123 /DNA_ID=CAMNT_0003524895 /DNA_START=287 /DNA_END=658 /DNA_ORIENTATION=-
MNSGRRKMFRANRSRDNFREFEHLLPDRSVEPEVDSVLPRTEDGEEYDRKSGFLNALWQSTVPEDLMNQSMGILQGEYKVTKRSLLYHTRTADEIGLFNKQTTDGKAQKNSVIIEASQSSREA